MVRIEKAGTAELNQDMQHQHHSWIFERTCWALMAVTLLAALMGFFGPGVLSKKVVGNPSFQLKYHTRERHHAPAELTLKIRPEAAKGPSIAVQLSAAYLQNILLERITPEPEKTEAGAADVTYYFAVREGDPVTVQFHYRANTIGRLQGSVGIGESRLNLRQFIFP